MKAILFTSLLTLSTAAAQPVITEIRIDQPGPDTDEYFEISGPAQETLDGHSYVVIGDGAAGSGVVESVTVLDGYSLPGDGVLFAAEASFSLGPAPDAVVSLSFENADNVTHLLVEGFSGATGEDLDVDDDGDLDIEPWNRVVDCVSVLDALTGGDPTYCGKAVGPDASQAPGHVYWDGVWRIGEFDPSQGTDTPGTAAVPLPVELVDFVARSDDGAVYLTWSTVAETGNAGFMLDQERDGMFRHVAFIPAGPLPDGNHYFWTIPEPVPGFNRYRLRQLEVDGSPGDEWSTSIFVVPRPSLYLAPPYPNPASVATHVTLVSRIPQTANVDLLDVGGKHIARIFSGRIEREHRLTIPLPARGFASGPLLIRAEGAQDRIVRPIVVIH